jgi:hypothetical protein
MGRRAWNLTMVGYLLIPVVRVTADFLLLTQKWNYLLELEVSI